MIQRDFKSSGWRHYQRRLRRVARKEYYLRRIPWLSFCAVFAFLILAILLYSSSWLLAYLGQSDPHAQPKGSWQQTRAKPLIREELPKILGRNNLEQASESGSFRLTLAGHGTELIVETTLDMGLQNHISGLFRRSMTRQAAVVVLRPDTGQILALAYYDGLAGGKRANLCLQSRFPAASLFKIVSAAAAIETCGFTPDKSLHFRGKRHTLYKNQLTRGKGRYATEVSFRKAFSSSINPVFGKIGMYDLGKNRITDYAHKFLFNHAIPFDLPLAASHIQIPEDDFAMAEIASGFNRTTLMSPLHAALITSAVANNGSIMAPWLTKRIRNESGEVLYRAKPSKLASPIKEDTARTLRVLMEDTVRRGTCSKAFLRLRNNRAFRDMKLGAKTGTINSSSDEYKYDWLTAYAIPAQKRGGVCISVLAVHGEKLGIRAKDLAAHIIRYHFTI